MQPKRWQVWQNMDCNWWKRHLACFHCWRAFPVVSAFFLTLMRQVSLFVMSWPNPLLYSNGSPTKMTWHDSFVESSSCRRNSKLMTVARIQLKFKGGAFWQSESNLLLWNESSLILLDGQTTTGDLSMAGWNNRGNWAEKICRGQKGSEYNIWIHQWYLWHHIRISGLQTLSGTLTCLSPVL